MRKTIPMSAMNALDTNDMEAPFPVPHPIRNASSPERAWGHKLRCEFSHVAGENAALGTSSTVAETPRPGAQAAVHDRGLGEFDADGDTLDDFGEVACTGFEGEQRELRA